LHENVDVMEENHKPAMVFLVELGDFSLNFDVEFWSSEGNIKKTKHEINTQVLKRFDKAGIKIPFPTQIEYQVHVDEV
ncbi:MAG: mechanosensitive ion channel, partial [Candidatus Undinarchaeales archaeon]|nr:mechanosensitive ion channel [Candidatus Undinarchaeales archaeon]